jgi:hypothetical protein
MAASLHLNPTQIGVDSNNRWITHIDDSACAKACSPIKPVIAPQLVHFHTPAIVDRRRSQSHGEGMRSLLSVRPRQTPPDCAEMGLLVVAHET